MNSANTSSPEKEAAHPSLRFQVQIEGMTCANCAVSVRKYLEKLHLKDVYVDYITGEVVFASEVPPDFDAIARGLQQMGYRVVEKGEEGKHYRRLKRMVLAAAVLTFPLLLPMFGVGGIVANPYFHAVMATVVYGIGLAAFARGAVESLKSGSPNMDVLIMLGATAAYVYSLVGLASGRADMIFFETTASIITLVLVGHWLEARAVKKTAEAMERLAGKQIKQARVLVDGRVEERPLDEVRAGDLVVVATGDTIPVDGVVVEGQANVDESMLTGEALPVRRKAGDSVYAGTLVVEGSLVVRTEKTGKETVLGEIIRILKQARQQKAQVQRLADRVSAIFVPAVVAIAVVAVGVNFWIFGVPFSEALLRGVAVLVISCPCALGLATPTAVTVGLGKAALHGILIRGGAVIEKIPRLQVMFFDKTGTLTTGTFKTVRIERLPSSPYPVSTLKAMLYALERHSSHPLARGMVMALQAEVSDVPEVTDIKEQKGQGIRGTWEGHSVFVGRLPHGMEADPSAVAAIRIDDAWVAVIYLEDEIRPDAASLIRYLKRRHIRPVILSGDREARVRQVAQALGIEEWHAALAPEEKMAIIEQYHEKTTVGVVGDGINDAPALAKADVGISFGGASDLAIRAGDVILITNRLHSIVTLDQIARQTFRVIKQNLFWAFFYNVLAIPLAAAGFLHPMIAAASMALSDVIVVGNSILLKYRKIKL